VEIARGEVVALLQVDALFGSFTNGVGRDRSELVGEPPDELGKLALAPAHPGQLPDQLGALPVGLFENPTEDECQTAWTIGDGRLGKGLDLGQPGLRRDVARGDPT